MRKFIFNIMRLFASISEAHQSEMSEEKFALPCNTRERVLQSLISAEDKSTHKIHASFKAQGTHDTRGVPKVDFKIN